MNLHVLKEITEQKSLKNRFRKKTNEIDNIKIRKKKQDKGRQGCLTHIEDFPYLNLCICILELKQGRGIQCWIFHTLAYLSTPAVTILCMLRVPGWKSALYTGSRSCQDISGVVTFIFPVKLTVSTREKVVELVFMNVGVN